MIMNRGAETDKENVDMEDMEDIDVDDDDGIDVVDNEGCDDGRQMMQFPCASPLVLLRM